LRRCGGKIHHQLAQLQLSGHDPVVAACYPRSLITRTGTQLRQSLHSVGVVGACNVLRCACEPLREWAGSWGRLGGALTRKPGLIDRRLKTVVQGATCAARSRRRGASAVASRPRAPAEDHAGNDPKQPSEDRGEDDDPHERHHRRTDHPAELDLMRVGNRERDQADDQRDGEERV
jgi:hypothetical protein